MKYFPIAFVFGCLLMATFILIYSIWKFDFDKWYEYFVPAVQIPVCLTKNANQNRTKVIHQTFFVILTCPWDQDTIIGWILEFILGSVAGFGYFIINNAFLSFFIGICFYHKAYSKHIRALLDKLEKARDPKSVENADDILSGVVWFHNLAKKSFELSAEVYSIFILIILICSMLFLACSIFEMDLVRKYYIYIYFNTDQIMKSFEFFRQCSTWTSIFFF